MPIESRPPIHVGILDAAIEINLTEPLYPKDIEPLLARIAALEASLGSLQSQTACIKQDVIKLLLRSE